MPCFGVSSLFCLYMLWTLFHKLPFPHLSLVFQHGSNLVGMSDLNVPEQLYQYMVGGHRRFQAGMHREKHKSPSYQIKVSPHRYSSLKVVVFIPALVKEICSF